ncbi:MAG: polymer-forming cytoskeletal protein [Deltaproteobacteria bacterium]|jgi:cytoskeletal protein CcmA (bactofilin family)|nr:polymer-forming cytoskeletal protein [Deltaproteobacteria bacterium]
MFGKKDKAKSSKHVWNAFFSSSVEIEGSLRFTGLLNIDGHLTGAIVAHGMLVTGVNAVINGDVFVENLILSGTVHGNIYVTGEVHLNNTAKVVGNVNYSSLSIVPGAVHEGNSHLFTEGERIELLKRIQAEIGNAPEKDDDSKELKGVLPAPGIKPEEAEGVAGEEEEGEAAPLAAAESVS